MNNLWVNFLVGAVALTALWSLLTYILVRLLRITSPAARAFLFMAPLTAAFGVRLTLAAGWRVEALALCVAGASVFLARDLCCYCRFCRVLVANARPDRSLQEVTDSLAGEFGAKRVPRALVHDVPSLGPMVVGMQDPALVVPRELVGLLTREELRTLLAHELAHIQRHDVARKLALLILRRLAFWNPVASWPYRWLSLETERACDNLAVKVTGRPGTLARTLLKVERFMSTRCAEKASDAGLLTVPRGDSHIAARIRSLANFQHPERPLVTVSKVALILSVFAAVCLHPATCWLTVFH